MAKEKAELVVLDEGHDAGVVQACCADSAQQAKVR